MHTIAGWLPALLFAVGIALTWANRPLWKPVNVPEGPEEGFANMKESKVKTDRWFVEKALNERPKKIIEDRIDTMATQDDTTAGSSRTSR